MVYVQNILLYIKYIHWNWIQENNLYYMLKFSILNYHKNKIASYNVYFEVNVWIYLKVINLKFVENNQYTSWYFIYKINYHASMAMETISCVVKTSKAL